MNRFLFSFRIGGLVAVRPGIFSLFFMLLSGPLLWAQSAEFMSETLSIKTSQIQNLFQLRKGSNLELAFENGQKHNFKFSGTIVNFLNQGETSGSISVALKTERSAAKLLLSRRMFKGNVVYTIILMPEGSSEAYKLQSETKEEFVLTRTTKDKVVTE